MTEMLLRSASLGDLIVVQTSEYTYTNLYASAYSTPRLYGRAYSS